MFRAYPATAEQIKPVTALNHFLQSVEKYFSLTAHFSRHKRSAWFPNSKNIFVDELCKVLKCCCRPQFQLVMLHLAADKCRLSPMLYLFPISSAAAASVPSWFSLSVGCNRLLIVSGRREGGGHTVKITPLDRSPPLTCLPHFACTPIPLTRNEGEPCLLSIFSLLHSCTVSLFQDGSWSL